MQCPAVMNQLAATALLLAEPKGSLLRVLREGGMGTSTASPRDYACSRETSVGSRCGAPSGFAVPLLEAACRAPDLAAWRHGYECLLENGDVQLDLALRERAIEHAYKPLSDRNTIRPGRLELGAYRLPG